MIASRCPYIEYIISYFYNINNLFIKNLLEHLKMRFRGFVASGEAVTKQNERTNARDKQKRKSPKKKTEKKEKKKIYTVLIKKHIPRK